MARPFALRIGFWPSLWSSRIPAPNRPSYLHTERSTDALRTLMEGSTLRKARKNYSPQEKVTILRRHLLDKVSVLRLCTEFQLQPTVFYRWLKQLFDNGAAALRRKLTAGKRPNTRQRCILVLQGTLETRESREAEQRWMISLTQGRFCSEQVTRAIGDALSQEDV